MQTSIYKYFKVLLLILLAFVLVIFTLKYYSSKKAIDSNEQLSTSGEQNNIETATTTAIKTEVQSTTTTEIDVPVKVTNSGITGTTSIGPNCPVEIYTTNVYGGTGANSATNVNCSQKPYQAKFAITSSDGSKLIKYFTSDAKGKFSVMVEPGIYKIRASNPENVFPRCNAIGIVKVVAGKKTVANVYCDSGIRTPVPVQTQMQVN